MQSFDTTIQLATIRRNDLLRASARGRVARLARRRRNARTVRTNSTNSTEGA